MPRVLRKHLSHALKWTANLLEEQSPATAITLINGERSRLNRLEDKVDQVVIQLSSTNTKVNILMSMGFTVASAYIYSLFK